MQQTCIASNKPFSIKIRYTSANTECIEYYYNCLSLAFRDKLTAVIT